MVQRSNYSLSETAIVEWLIDMKWLLEVMLLLELVYGLIEFVKVDYNLIL